MTTTPEAYREMEPARNCDTEIRIELISDYQKYNAILVAFTVKRCEVKPNVVEVTGYIR